jgi:hypothetical protein
MYTLETVESLHAYADRLHRDAARTAASVTGRRLPVRSLLRKGRRTS